MKKTFPVAVIALLVLLAGAQLVRPARTNPPANAPLPIDDPAAEAVFRRACFDCHSNQTRWPWYAGVAPFSWLVVRDVNEGRSKMNFSTWKDPEGELPEEICEEVRKGAMPLKIYLSLHPEARLTQADKEALCGWAGRAAPASATAEDDEDD
ncbi:MAG TPA: heme-binding domain-containing protein [Thermoanaerobaculia bacterium]